MKYYIDVTLKPDAEMRENVLLNTVYTKFHKILFDQKSNDIAVSFPKYKVLLGNVIRIHGLQNSLTNLQKGEWLGGIVGYCAIGDVLPVPDGVQYRKVSRKQSNMTEAKLRRLIKRGSISEKDIKAYKAKMFSQGLDNPYFELQSHSTQQRHRRFIDFGPLLDNPVSGTYDYFGLSKTATVPWF